MAVKADHYIIRMLPPEPEDRESVIDRVLAANGYVRGTASVDFRVDSSATSDAYMTGLLLNYESIGVAVDDTRSKMHKFKGGATGKLIAVFHRMLEQDVASKPSVADHVETHLMQAAEKGDVALVKSLIQEGADLNARNKDGDTSLNIAARNGRTGVAEALIKAGADVQVKDSHGWSPLLDAALFGGTDLIQRLISAGADVNAKGNQGETALMLAAFGGRSEVVRVLIEAGAEVDARNNRGNTALMEAALGGDHTHAAVVRALIEAGADVNAREVDGQTALSVATLKGHKQVIQILRRASVPHAKQRKRWWEFWR